MARYSILITNVGVPVAGQAPTVIAWRYKDGSGDPAPGIPVPTVNELDAVNAPGWYYFETTPDKEIVMTIDCDPGGGTGLPDAERYVGTIVSPYDFEVAGDAWDALETDHTTASSFGELMKVIAGLAFRYYRQYDHVYNANGQLTSCTVRVYGTQAEFNADTPLVTLYWTTTYVGTDVNEAACDTTP
jgi:hypothetical protein